MKSLRELQMGFAGAVRDPRAVERFGPRVRAGNLGGARRLQIYRNNHYQTLVGALQATYPAVERLVGDGFFRQSARCYAQARPSAGGDIHDYGQDFGEFLDDLPGTAGFPYLGDVARLEWAYHAAYHAEMRPPMDLDGLAAMDPEDHGRLRFDLQPAARLVYSAFPVMDIWQANRPDPMSADTIDLARGGARLLVMPEGVEVAFHPLNAGEFTLLQALEAGHCLGDAHLRATGAEPVFDLGAALRRHAHIGTFTAWRL